MKGTYCVATNAINGKTVEIPRDRLTLTADAIPTLFLNLPPHLSKKLPSKRKTATSTGNVSSKRPKDDCCHDQEQDSAMDSVGVDATSASCCYSNDRGLASLKEDLSKYWARHLISSSSDMVAFSVRSSSGESLSFQKILTCSVTNAGALLLTQAFTARHMSRGQW